jgi:hypothetical protein
MRNCHKLYRYTLQCSCKIETDEETTLETTELEAEDVCEQYDYCMEHLSFCVQSWILDEARDRELLEEFELVDCQLRLDPEVTGFSVDFFFVSRHSSSLPVSAPSTYCTETPIIPLDLNHEERIVALLHDSIPIDEKQYLLLEPLLPWAADSL